MKSSLSLNLIGIAIFATACGRSQPATISDTPFVADSNTGGLAFLQATSGEQIILSYNALTKMQTSLVDHKYTAEDIGFTVRGACDISPENSLEVHIWNEKKVTWSDGNVVQNWSLDGSVQKIKLERGQVDASGCIYQGRLDRFLVDITTGGPGQIDFRQKLAIRKLGLDLSDTLTWLKDPVSSSNDFQLRLRDAQEKSLEETASQILKEQFSCEDGNLSVGTGAGSFVLQLKGSKAEAAWLATREYNAFGRTIGLGGRVSVAEEVTPAPRFVTIDGTRTFIMNFNARDPSGKFHTSSAIVEPSSTLQIDDGGIAVFQLRGSKHISDSKFESVPVYRVEFNNCIANP